jgi:hypothetical protein
VKVCSSELTFTTVVKLYVTKTLTFLYLELHWLLIRTHTHYFAVITSLIFFPEIFMIHILIIKIFFNIEETVKTFTPVDFDRRLMKIVSNNKDEHAAYWKISFEKGVDPSVEDALPESEDDLHRFPRLKLVHTQRRYDFGFGTPSCMSNYIVYFKCTFC